MASEGLPQNIDAALREGGLDPDGVVEIVQRALAEDLDGGVDVTSVATVPEDQQAVLDLVVRGGGVIAGLPVAAAVFVLASQGRVECRFVPDGSRVSHDEVVLTATGPTRDLLLGERTALNLLCRLSGIATLTRRWVDIIGARHTRVRDTRKTTAGLRALEKYAVRCGGGVNHRMSLSDEALVKDNHVVAAGGVAQAFTMVRDSFPGLTIEVEVDSLDQLEEALSAGAKLVLLDNFTVPDMKRAVALNNGRALLEASGGLTLDSAAEVAETGVDYVAIGALTHSAPVLDIGADLRPVT